MKNQISNLMKIKYESKNLLSIIMAVHRKVGKNKPSLSFNWGIPISDALCLS